MWHVVQKKVKAWQGCSLRSFTSSGIGEGGKTIDEWLYGLILRYVSYVLTLLTAELLFLHLGVDFIVAVFACLYAGRLLNFSIEKRLNQLIIGFVIFIHLNCI